MYQNDYYFYNGELKNNKILAVIRFLIPSLFTFIRCSRVTTPSEIFGRFVGATHLMHVLRGF